jgi:hypothetical protein
MQTITRRLIRYSISFAFFTLFVSTASAATVGNAASAGIQSVPIPEASTVAAFGLIAVELLRRRRRK